ncbi:MAG: hypothetical protein ACRCZS_21055 [Chroococcidiopsis sp.]
MTFNEMDAVNAMRQASMTAHEYFDYGVKAIEDAYPKASADAKVVAASNFAIAAALDFLATSMSGGVRDSVLKGALENIASANLQAPEI